MLLTNLSPGEPPAELRLRLQHVWRLCNPAELDKYSALGTAWTDAEVSFPDFSHRVPSHLFTCSQFLLAVCFQGT
ncbi:hypothetical protein LINGRAHAP2_LOCUS14468 [Linum grandiflorum]